MKSQTIQLNNLDSVAYISNQARRILNGCVKDKKQRIECVFRNAESARSLKQNKLIHAIFKDISVNASHVGKGEFYSPKIWKEFLKNEFLQPESLCVMGKVVEVRKSTANLTKKECADFVNNIVRFCHEHEIELTMKTEDYEFLTR